jgi:hypothetical protein
MLNIKLAAANSIRLNASAKWTVPLQEWQQAEHNVKEANSIGMAITILDSVP